MKSLVILVLFGTHIFRTDNDKLYRSTKAKPPQTLYLSNGDILHRREARPGAAQAVAVAGGKIIAVGTNADIQKLKGPKTEVIDLGGHFAMPGFNDAHVHLGSGGFEKLNVDLVGAKSPGRNERPHCCAREDGSAR